MSIAVIRATFNCDGCGKQFKVDMDPARRAWERRQSLMDLAEDAIRGGTDSEGGFCSVQADMHLCGDCTTVADSIGDEDHKPTRDEITDALEDALAA